MVPLFLRPSMPVFPPSKFRPVRYAIVDIETTGSYAAANGIIEISIQVFDGEAVVESYETLINPHQAIPRYIQAFTGINNEMVQEAPSFGDVAAHVLQPAAGRCFCSAQRQLRLFVHQEPPAGIRL
jgi:DNA polymerase III epsilon subunit-like protein